MFMSKIFDVISNNTSRNNIENVNLFIIPALFDLLLGIQSRIESFISK